MRERPTTQEEVLNTGRCPRCGGETCGHSDAEQRVAFLKLPTTTQTIEHPSEGATYSTDDYGVYEYGVYPRGSVLAGQERRTFLGSFETLAEAQAAFPHAEESPGQYRPPYLGL